MMAGKGRLCIAAGVVGVQVMVTAAVSAGRRHGWSITGWSALCPMCGSRLEENVVYNNNIYQ